ncbi:MAG: hypothetical protein QOC75_129, partial [Pseudonocardiales bacterium]|nr:hypothetical protein [Pseudonocardiales bacterium]
MTVSRLGTVTGVVRPYRGVSADERRTERRQRLVTACLDLVGEGGVSTVTAQAVAERAGLTRRYFYESFADRDAVLVEALDGMFSTLGG